ncbi:Fic family protein [Herbaspirillum sp. alder98]|uniref:Fic family protein n=1 Tax=Herbaspirillum sp. alder98 TaxID=2913096 RepID=UPI001CD895F3|nr:Fic family protein [Herbaspirillum sp. alder98]MCA1324920.1 Fic family protein [Herbaspirillum sp. alder98]
MYIWSDEAWPAWQYDLERLAHPLSEVALAQGILLGRLMDIGADQRDMASLTALTEDVVKTSAIEGETLNVASVRSSLARRLGVDIGALTPADRHIDGVVEMILDATQNFDLPLTQERLFGWHAALFPTGYSGMQQIDVATWRQAENDPMQVVSGAYGKQKVHFEAPPAAALPDETRRFLNWINHDETHPPLIKAGLGHLWFVTLHPFDDGNGRIARAIGDYLLSKADRSRQRFYSVSAQIQRERNAYYDQLERTQKGTLDVTGWLAWFLETLKHAFEQTSFTLNDVIAKARFWQTWRQAPLNERQTRMLNKLLDGFDGKLTSTKWGQIAKCSPDTALRDINELIALGILKRTEGGGRSTSYVLA